VAAVGVHERSRGVLPEGEPGLARTVTVRTAEGVGIARGGSRESVKATGVAAAAVPVGGRLAGGASQVQPRLAVGAGGVVAHAAVVVDLAAVEGRSSTGSTALVGASTATVAARAHERSASSAVHLGEGVDVLQLRAAEVAGVVATSRTVAVAATSTKAAAPTATAVAERRVLALELGLDALAVGRVADRGENGADALDELKS